MLKLNDVVTLKKFEPTIYTNWQDRFHRFVGLEAKVILIDPVTSRIHVKFPSGHVIEWVTGGILESPDIKEKEKVLVGNKKNVFIDEKYEYVSKEGNMHIVKNPVGFKAFKYVKKQEE